MSNLGGLEILTILVIALVVLGPTKLPEAARSVGKAVNELRRISGGFQREMRDAMNEMNDASIEAEARARGAHHTPPTPPAEPTSGGAPSDAGSGSGGSDPAPGADPSSGPAPTSDE